MKKGRTPAHILLAIMLLFSLLTPYGAQANSQVSANSAYSEVVDTRTMDLAPGVHYTWYDMKIERGLEKIHALEFDPKQSFLKLQSGTTNGKVYGMQGVSGMAADADAEGNRVIAAINADFYDTGNGLPLGLFIGDGVILSSPTGNRNAFGMKEDGTAIIGQPALSSTLSIDGQSIPLSHINRLRGDNQLLLYTNDFYSSTRTNATGNEIVLDVLEGEVKSGSTLSLKVVEIRNSQGDTALQEGQVVLSASGTARNLIQNLVVGQQVEASFTLNGEWNDAIMAVGGNQLLVVNGVVPTFSDATYHPRTAVGVKADGKLVMLTVDGRAPGFSEGVTLEELGRILKDMDVVNAINLDGGGSTTFLAKLPGDSARTIMNRPSDGGERTTSNSILLINTAPEGPATHLAVRPNMERVLAGASISLSAAGVDASGHPAALIDPVQWSVSAPLGTIADSGTFTAGAEAGFVEVEAESGGLAGKAVVEVVDTLSHLVFPDVLRSVDSGASVNFTVSALRDGQVIKADNNLLEWSVEGAIGEIDTNGVFTAAEGSQLEGKVYARYKGVESFVTLKVGVPPVVLENFENGMGRYHQTSGAAYVKSIASITSDEEYVRLGNGALKLEYDFRGQTGTSGTYLHVNGAANNIEIPGYPEKLGMWVYGDGQGYWLRAQLRDGSGAAVPVDFTTEAGGVDWVGWKYVEGEVPAGKPIPLKMDMPVRYMALGSKEKKEGVIYVDEIRALYGPSNEDVVPPTIQGLEPADGSTVNDSTPTIVAYAIDDRFDPGNHGGTTLIDPDSIRLYVNGELIEEGVGLYPPEGRIAYTPIESLPEGVNRVRLQVKDLSGNRATKEWSFYVETGAPKFVYNTPELIYAGNTYTLDVASINPANIIAGQIELDFDAEKAEGLMLLPGPKLTASHVSSVIHEGNGSVRLIFDDLHTLALTDEDILAQVQYTVKADATGNHLIAFVSGEVEAASGIAPFVGFPVTSAIAHHLRLSWDEDGIAQGFETAFSVADESGAPVQGAEVRTAAGLVIGTTDGNGTMRSNVLTQTLSQYQIQAVKGNQYSPIRTFIVSRLAGTPTPYNISVAMGQDPTVSRGLTWHTDPNTTGTVVEFVKQAEFAGFDHVNVQSAAGASYLFNTLDIGTIRVHKAEAGGLEPGTQYVYRVGDGAGNYSAQGSFATAEAAGDPLKFIFIGDSQASDRAGFKLWGDTIKEAFNAAPDAEFVIHAGDIVDSGFKENEWNLWFEAAQEQLMNTSLVAVVGNHEVMGDRGNDEFLAHFNQPGNGIDNLKGSNFSFDYKDVHFVVLNSEYDYEEQAAWLANDLAGTDKKWKIAVFHRGPYGSIYDTAIVRNAWTPIFDEYNVDLVLNGHDHLYLRTFPMKGNHPVQPGEGSIYVVGGSSGPKFYGLTERPWQEVVFTEQTQIYSYVEVDGDQLAFIAKKVSDGSIVDEFIISKGSGTPDITLSRIEMKGLSNEMFTGDEEQLTVEAVYSDLSRRTLTEGVAFSSSNEAVATANAAGLVTAAGAGVAVITAEYEGKQAAHTINVSDYSEPVKMLVLERFEQLTHLFHFSSNVKSSSMGLVGRPEAIPYGHHAASIMYDFSGTTGTSAAYLRLMDEHTGGVGRPIPGSPKSIGLWVYGDGNNHWLRAELEGSSGKTPVDFTTTTGLNWNGWKYVTAAVPSNMAGPIKINQIYVAELNNSNKNAGVLYFDQLSAFYTTSAVYGLDIVGLAPMQPGEHKQIKVFATQQGNTSPQEVTGAAFMSSNEAVATVDADGTVTALSAGIAYIAASYGDAPKAVQLLTVSADEIMPRSLHYSAASSMEIGSAQHVKLYAEYELSTGEDSIVSLVDIMEGASFESENPSVAAVDAAGRIQALAKGTTSITMSYKGLTLSFTLTVHDPQQVLQSIQIVPLPAMNVGTSGQVRVYGTYTNMEEPIELTEGVVFTSGKPAVASINESGSVAALTVGASMILATYEGKSSSFTLPVIQMADMPKTEMRAAWIASVDNIDWPRKGVVEAERQKRDFIDLLDELASTGINAVIVQIKPTADAFYPSELAPWSEWLTGKQGQNPGYNPLAFMLEEAHKRNMEFHAWFNPYRISLFDNLNHLAEDHPARDIGIISYGGKLFFDPGSPEAQAYITDSIMEVVNHYDIDAVHFDDYFYPYPVSGVDFPDNETYQLYKGEFTNKGDWRRHNVNTFLRNISQEIKAAKSHVKFGISPFGIWKNKSEDSRGSDTNGLSSYSAIFADSKSWIEDDEIKLDYITPQIYWNIGYGPAAYDVLIQWWSDAVAGRNIHLYSGQALYKVGTSSPVEWMNPEEFPNQVLYNRSFGEVKGNMLFSAKWFEQNPLAFADRLRNDLFRYPALVPSMPWLDNEAPDAPAMMAATATERGVELAWSDQAVNDDTAYYVIYRFEGETAGGLRAESILDIVRKHDGTEQVYVDAAAVPARVYTYVATAVDRLHNESSASNSLTVIQGEGPEPTITEIVISGLSSEMTVGHRAQSVVESVYSDGSRRTLTEGVTYSSSNEAVATIDASGFVYAASQGTTVISSTYGAWNASFQLTVRASTPGTVWTPPIVPAPEPGHMKLTESELRQKLQGSSVVLQFDKDFKELIVPANAADMLGDAPIVVDAPNLKITIPSEVLKALGGLSSEIGQDAAIALSANELPDEEANKLLAVASITSGAKLAAGSGIFQFQLILTDKLGNRYMLDEFPQPITIELSLNSDVDTAITGIYHIAADGALEYIGGIARNGSMKAEIAHFSQYAVLEYEKSFSDIKPDFWAAGSIRELAAKHIVAGISQDQFAPNRTVTRAEFAAMLVRMLGLRSASSASFIDVASDDWHAEAVAAAAEAGIINGVGNNKFAPDAEISRQEMTAMIVRAYEYSKGQAANLTDRLPFKDLSDSPEWALQAIKSAYSLGLANGHSESSFKPTDTATRAEGAKMIHNLLTLLQ